MSEMDLKMLLRLEIGSMIEIACACVVEAVRARY